MLTRNDPQVRQSYEHDETHESTRKHLWELPREFCFLDLFVVKRDSTKLSWFVSLQSTDSAPSPNTVMLLYKWGISAKQEK